MPKDLSKTRGAFAYVGRPSLECEVLRFAQDDSASGKDQ
jgi:hypothetical protein